MNIMKFGIGYSAYLTLFQKGTIRYKSKYEIDIVLSTDFMEKE